MFLLSYFSIFAFLYFYIFVSFYLVLLLISKKILCKKYNFRSINIEKKKYKEEIVIEKNIFIRILQKESKDFHSSCKEKLSLEFETVR